MQLDRDLGFVSHLRLYNEEGLQPTPAALRGSHLPVQVSSATVNSVVTGTTTPIANAGAVLYADEPLNGEVKGVISPQILDPLFSATLDINQEVLINNLTVRAGNDYTFYYPAGRSELVDDFYQRVDMGEINLTDTEMHNFGDLVVQRNNVVTNSVSSFTTADLPFLNNKSKEGNQNFDQTHRIECQIWQGNWGIYASSGIKTHATQYARKWGFFKGWVDLKVSKVTVSADVTFDLPNTISGVVTQTTAQVLVGSETNAAVAVKRFDWGTAQVGYTNAPGGIAQQIQSILLSNMTVTLANPAYVPPGTNPRPYYNPPTLVLTINKVTSNHTGLYNGNLVSLPLTW